MSYPGLKYTTKRYHVLKDCKWNEMIAVKLCNQCISKTLNLPDSENSRPRHLKRFANEQEISTKSTKPSAFWSRETRKSFKISAYCFQNFGLKQTYCKTAESTVFRICMNKTHISRKHHFRQC